MSECGPDESEWPPPLCVASSDDADARAVADERRSPIRLGLSSRSPLPLPPPSPLPLGGGALNGAAEEPSSKITPPLVEAAAAAAASASSLASIAATSCGPRSSGTAGWARRTAAAVAGCKLAQSVSIHAE